MSLQGVLKFKEKLKKLFHTQGHLDRATKTLFVVDTRVPFLIFFICIKFLHNVPIAGKFIDTTTFYPAARY